MFGFLKKKLKDAVLTLTRKVEEEGKEEIIEAIPEEIIKKTETEEAREQPSKKQGFFKKLFGGKTELAPQAPKQESRVQISSDNISETEKKIPAEEKQT